MTYAAIIVVFIILIALIVGITFGVRYMGREKPASKEGASVREHYGPPPGVYRALGLYELGDRGWTDYPYEYEANTASSISHMIERSA